MELWPTPKLKVKIESEFIGALIDSPGWRSIGDDAR